MLSSTTLSPPLFMKYGPIDVHPPTQAILPGSPINVSVSIGGMVGPAVLVDVYAVAMTLNSVGSAPTFGPPPAGVIVPVTANPISVQPGGPMQYFQVTAGTLPSGVTFLPIVFVAIERYTPATTQMTIGIGITAISASSNTQPDLGHMDPIRFLSILKDTIGTTVREEVREAFAEQYRKEEGEESR